MESLLYLGIMLAVICIWFLALKRPVYEAVLLAFIILLFVTGTWGNVLTYIDVGLSTSLLYSMVAFVAMSILLTKTKIVDTVSQLFFPLLVVSEAVQVILPLSPAPLWVLYQAPVPETLWLPAH